MFGRLSFAPAPKKKPGQTGRENKPDNHSSGDSNKRVHHSPSPWIMPTNRPIITNTTTASAAAALRISAISPPCENRRLFALCGVAIDLERKGQKLLNSPVDVLPGVGKVGALALVDFAVFDGRLELDG